MLDLIEKYRKAAGVVLVAVLTAVASALTDGITDREVVIVAGVFLAAFGTAFVPNLPTGVGAVAKAITTFLIGGTAVLAVVIAGGLTTAEFLEVVIAAFAAVGVTVGARNVGDYRDRALAIGRGVHTAHSSPGDFGSGLAES